MFCLTNVFWFIPYFCPMKKFGLLLCSVAALFFTNCNNGGDENGTDTPVKTTPILSYSVVSVHSHDTSYFTEGLEFYNGYLLESTGNYGPSKLVKIDPATNKIVQQVELDEKYFGEGITVLHDTLYQLTYKEHTVLIYTAKDFKKIKELHLNPEGWGLTNDGKQLYMTDGSEKIYILDTETMKEVDYLNVYTKGTKIKAVNELEWVNGKIYGNIYQKDAIAVIDPKTGAVEGVLDLSALEGRITRHQDVDVLNGIAYNPKTKTFFVTGKNWDKMFEIRIHE